MRLRACAGPERDQANRPTINPSCASTGHARLSTNSVDMLVHVWRFSAWGLALRRTRNFAASATLRRRHAGPGGVAYDFSGVYSTTLAGLSLPIVVQDFASIVNSAIAQVGR